MKRQAELYLRNPLLFRCVALSLALGMLAVGCLALYAIWTDVLPIFARLYRGAPMIETPFGAFFVIAAVPLMPIIVTAATISAFTGRKFDPPRATRLYRFQLGSFWLCLLLMVVAPALVALTTVTLLAKGYRTCPELRMPGSGRHLYWVNDERACFTPDFYDSDERPCKKIGQQQVCIQVDGREALGPQIAQ
nr:hypothetical protein [uncultured Pseudomonas sp.]